MDYNLDHAMLILSRTPGTLNGWLRDLPEPWVTGNEGPGTWSPYDIVGHLIHGEKADWIPRTIHLLENGEGPPFEPFDRFAQFEDSKGRTLGELLDEFGERRSANLATLEGMELTADHLERPGTHPEFGRITLGQLLSTWVVHDLGHIAQIARVMCKQYGEAVGPWAKYLSVLAPRG